MSNEPCGLRMTEEALREHLAIMDIAESSINDALETYEKDPKEISYLLNQVNAVKRIIDAACRDLHSVHDYLTDEMRRKKMKIRLATA